MTRLIKVLKGILNHPFNQGYRINAIARFFMWQLNIRMNPYPVVYDFTSKSRLILKKGLSAATGNLYNGLFEFSDMAFVVHFLREDDLFVDVGANIGSYTTLAGVESGARCLAYEPVPQAFDMLADNIALNHLGSKVELHRMAVGAKKGTVAFTSTLDAINHVATSADDNTLEVPLISLDDAIAGRKPLLLKIDVEGFETEVIKGAKKTLDQASLQAVVIELNGLGNRYGFDEKGVHNYLLKVGFLPYCYFPFERRLEKLASFGNKNTIYIRDITFAEERVTKASPIIVQNRQV